MVSKGSSSVLVLDLCLAGLEELEGCLSTYDQLNRLRWRGAKGNAFHEIPTYPGYDYKGLMYYTKHR